MWGWRCGGFLGGGGRWVCEGCEMCEGVRGEVGV